jgi:hypothetical protein
MSRITVPLPDELVLQAKRHASLTGRSFNQLIADALCHEMQRPAKPRCLSEPLPVFEGNGLRPGVDLSDYSALLDLIDER